MRKIQDVKYILKLSQARPDSNSCIRLVTAYLCFIEDRIKVQTTDGVIHLIEPYKGPHLKHNQTIMFTGKMLAGGYLEGMIRPVSNQAVRNFKEYAVILKNKGQFIKKDVQKIAKKDVQKIAKKDVQKIAKKDVQKIAKEPQQVMIEHF